MSYKLGIREADLAVLLEACTKSLDIHAFKNRKCNKATQAKKLTKKIN